MKSRHSKCKDQDFHKRT